MISQQVQQLPQIVGFSESDSQVGQESFEELFHRLLGMKPDYGITYSGGRYHLIDQDFILSGFVQIKEGLFRQLHRALFLPGRLHEGCFPGFGAIPERIARLPQ